MIALETASRCATRMSARPCCAQSSQCALVALSGFDSGCWFGLVLVLVVCIQRVLVLACGRRSNEVQVEPFFARPARSDVRICSALPTRVRPSRAAEPAQPKRRYCYTIERRPNGAALSALPTQPHPSALGCHQLGRDCWPAARAETLVTRLLFLRNFHSSLSAASS